MEVSAREGRGEAGGLLLPPPDDGDGSLQLELSQGWLRDRGQADRHGGRDPGPAGDADGGVQLLQPLGPSLQSLLLHERQFTPLH